MERIFTTMLRDTHLWSLLILFGLCFPQCGSPQLIPKVKPNIIIIYVDDMGLGDANFSGGTFVETPNLNRLARNGKVFTKYYTPAPVCSPSRVALLTGQYPIRWGINTFLHNKKYNRAVEQVNFLKAEAPSMASALKAEGYRTAHFGKWHMGGGRDVENAPRIEEYGFDEISSTWESPQPDPLLTGGNWIWGEKDSIKRWERTDYFVEKALDFMAKNSEHPCFINLWPDDIHTPWVPDKETMADGWKKTAKELAKLKPVMRDFDRSIGHLIEVLQKRNQLDQTMIIFTSDNGPAPSFGRLRTNGLRGVKNSLYEGGVLMPMIVHWPAEIKGGQIDSVSIISSIDLFPTLLAISNASSERNWASDGEDISEMLLSEATFGNERSLFFEFGRNRHFAKPHDTLDRSPHIAIRTQDWKLLTSSDGSVTELFNLTADPTESSDVSTQYPERTQALKSKAISWFEQTDKSNIQ